MHSARNKKEGSNEQWTGHEAERLMAEQDGDRVCKSWGLRTGDLTIHKGEESRLKVPCTPGTRTSMHKARGHKGLHSHSQNWGLKSAHQPGQAGNLALCQSPYGKRGSIRNENQGSPQAQMCTPNHITPNPGQPANLAGHQQRRKQIPLRNAFVI